MSAALFLIRERYKLHPHPEGGYYSEVYRGPDIVAHQGLPHRYNDDRNTVSLMYYMLESPGFSALHKLRSDEIWHWVNGGPMELIAVARDGSSVQRFIIGPDFGTQEPTAVVPHGLWFAARPLDSYSVVSCVVAPAFSFDDLEFASEATLRTFSPHVARDIRQFLRVSKQTPKPAYR